MSSSSIAVKAAWDPEAKLFYIEYSDLFLFADCPSGTS
jgi:hypothetical protein